MCVAGTPRGKIGVVTRAAFFRAGSPERPSMSTLALPQRSLFKPETLEKKMEVCAGGVTLSPEDRVELLAILAADVDPSVAERATGALLTQPIDYFIKALERADSDSLLFRYCAENLGTRPGVADALARNVGCPTARVTQLAPHLTTNGVQALLDNLERFCENPALVEAVMQSSTPSAEQRTLLDEMKKGAMSLAEIEEAVAEIEPDAAKRETLMQRVGHMSVGQRLTLAIKGARTERLMLIRDPNKLVQRAVLQSPKLTDSEVEGFAGMTNLSKEVLRAISSMRIFMKNYTIAKNLVNNPKTPLDVSLHLFPRLTATDLLKLTTNKNIPETLRTSAVKLHRKRKMGTE
jgi:hypothetical protein